MTFRRSSKPLAVAVLLAGTLLLGACGSSGDDTSSSDSGTSDTTTAGSAAVSDKKPAVEIPEGAPPAQLETKDIIVGEGDEATQGKNVSVQYVGVSYSTKKEFDASWNRGKPFSFVLGAGDVIKGWDQGVAGMKEGGRRQLTIPPDLGYGSMGSPPVIKPNETLVFVVDLVSVS